MIDILRGVGERVLSREYIARDPRTGKPLNVARASKKKQYIETEEGPWLALHKDQIIPLATPNSSNIEVSWRSKKYSLSRKDGVMALTRIKGNGSNQAHATLLLALEDADHEVRVSGLKALPEVATQKSDELFDWLSVLLDDSNLSVRKAASECLSISAPVFPSGIDIILHNELRSADSSRRNFAFKGLDLLCEAWPEVACDHIDELFLESHPMLRIKGAKLLGKLLHKGGSAAWDLISWALNDNEVKVRQAAAKTLPRLAKSETRLATILSERALSDTDSDVRLSAVKAIRLLDKDSGRARELILRGASSSDIKVRRACIDMLPILYGEEVLRGIAIDLLKTETDQKLRESLQEMALDESLEGSEAEKNKFLAPAPAIPKLDREVAEAQGKRIGLEIISPESSQKVNKQNDAKQSIETKPLPRDSGLYRSVSQDELMGYEDDDDY